MTPMIIYDFFIQALIFKPLIHIDAHMRNFLKSFLNLLPKATINNLFSEIISSRFPHHCLIIMDGSVSHNSAGFLFFFCGTKY